MANQLLTRQEITFESLEILENTCCIIPNLYRDPEKEFGKKGGKIGDTIYMRKPARAIGRDGQAYTPEGMTDTEVPLTINQQSGVDFEFSSAEKFESLDDLKNRYLNAYMASLSNKLDSRMATIMVQNTANLVGTVGTIPGLSGSDAFQIYSQAGQKLGEMGFPSNKANKGNRNLVLSEAQRVGWNTYTKAFYNPSDSLTKQWKTGQIDNALGYQWMTSELTPKQVLGTFGGTPAINGANQTGSSIICNGASNSITNWGVIGDVVSFAGVFAVNPQTRLSTGSLQQFVLQANASSDGSGNITLVVSPALVPSGQFQNVTASPATGALIQVYNTAAAGQAALSALTSTQAMLWAPEAFGFASFPGDVPEGVDMGATMMFSGQSSDIGVELRFARIWDGYRDQWVNRFDVYYGGAPVYPEGAVRIAS